MVVSICLNKLDLFEVNYFLWSQEEKINLFLGENIFKLFCEKYLDLDEFEKREACCLLVTLCKLVFPLHMDLANR